MKFNGIYTGRVVDNKDPEHRGRVKVFCSNPKIHRHVLHDKDKTSISYKFPGNEYFDKEFIKTIKPLLPWAIITQSLLGGSSAATYDASRDRATRSNNVFDEYDNVPIYNNEGYDTTPMEALRHHIVSDAFCVPPSTMVPHCNPYGAINYLAPTYSNMPTGLYNIPKVGSMVLVQFIKGSLNMPIVTGYISDSESIQLIMQEGDIPIGIPDNFEEV